MNAVQNKALELVKTMLGPKLLLTEYEVSACTSVPVDTLRSHRKKGIGFRTIKVGRLVRYPVADVLAFISEQIQP